MGFGRATLPVAIPQWAKNETRDTGIQPQPGFRTVVQAHATAPMPSALTQSPREALSPKTGLEVTVGATGHGLAVPRH